MIAHYELYLRQSLVSVKLGENTYFFNREGSTGIIEPFWTNSPPASPKVHERGYWEAIQIYMKQQKKFIWKQKFQQIPIKKQQYITSNLIWKNFSA